MKEVIQVKGRICSIRMILPYAILVTCRQGDAPYFYTEYHQVHLSHLYQSALRSKPGISKLRYIHRSTLPHCRRRFAMSPTSTIATNIIMFRRLLP